MKRWICVLGIGLLLSGCAAVDTFETIGDDYVSEVMAPAGKLEVDFPPDTVVLAMNDDLQGCIYLCPDYTLSLQTFASGNLEATIQQVSGFKDVQPLRTRMGGLDRYDWVWSTVEEAGDMVSRAAVLDDGAYHYALCVTASADTVGVLEQEWERLFASLRVV